MKWKTLLAVTLCGHAALAQTQRPNFVRNQTVWLNATGEVVKHDINASSAARTQQLAIEFGTAGKSGVPGTLEIVCLGTNPRGDQVAIAGHHEPIIAEPPGLAQKPDGSPELQPIHFNYNSVSNRYGAYGVKLGGWIIRIVAPDGSILAVKGSDGSLENLASDPEQWSRFTSHVAWH